LLPHGAKRTRQPPKFAVFSVGQPCHVLPRTASPSADMTAWAREGATLPRCIPLNSAARQGCGKRKKGGHGCALACHNSVMPSPSPFPKYHPHGHRAPTLLRAGNSLSQMPAPGLLLWRDGQREDFRLRHSPSAWLPCSAAEMGFLCAVRQEGRGRAVAQNGRRPRARR